MAIKKVLQIGVDKSPYEILELFCKKAGKSPLVLGYQQGLIEAQLGQGSGEILAQIVADFMYAGLYYAKKYPDSINLALIKPKNLEEAEKITEKMQEIFDSDGKEIREKANGTDKPNNQEYIQ